MLHYDSKIGYACSFMLTLKGLVTQKRKLIYPHDPNPYDCYGTQKEKF